MLVFVVVAVVVAVPLVAVAVAVEVRVAVVVGGRGPRFCFFPRCGSAFVPLGLPRPGSAWLGLARSLWQ